MSHRSQMCVTCILSKGTSCISSRKALANARLVILESAKITPPSCDHPKRQRCSNKIFALDVIGIMPPVNSA